jgi:hypothetical protein
MKYSEGGFTLNILFNGCMSDGAWQSTIAADSMSLYRASVGSTEAR